MKSSWAYNNGKRQLKACLPIVPTVGWIENKLHNTVYAEQKHNELVIKTYANRAQCMRKIEKLQAEGIDCLISENHPFLIILNNK